MGIGPRDPERLAWRDVLHRAVRWHRTRWRFYRAVASERTNGTRVTGEVIGHGDYVSHGRTMYFPIYRVTLADGRTIESEATTAMAATWKSPKVGVRRPLVYHEGMKPAFSQLSWLPYLPAMIMAALGAGFAAVTVIVALVSSSSHDTDRSSRDHAHHHASRLHHGDRE